MAFSFLGSAQAYLYLEKENDLPERRWKQGEKIDLLLMNGDEEVWRQGYFQGGDSLGLILGTRYYPFSEIHAVSYSRGVLPIVSKSLLAGATLFTGIALVNGLINNDSPVIRESQIWWGLGIFGAGFLLDQFAYAKRYMVDGYHFKIINISDLNR